ncbi:hypothetical protein FRY74_02545 [Vicingus serpentipes]|uniref:Uncharacterized protein n=1 Tax=Vicingus serpentipes TaxID=1926625 RepID=A0A5C6S0E7_9FLAO|nr:hypothetical protein [Vicingus serpentipes]TXB67082.1 hypothetical protein FRY74_02545 [Vicingus serpentipes]
MKNNVVLLLNVLLCLVLIGCNNTNLSFSKRKYLGKFKPPKVVVEKKTPEVFQPILIAGNVNNDYQNILLIDENDNRTLFLKENKIDSQVLETKNRKYTISELSKIVKEKNILNQQEQDKPNSEYANKKGRNAFGMSILGILTIWLLGLGLIFIIIGYFEGIKSLEAGKLNPENYIEKGAATFAVVVGRIFFILLSIVIILMMFISQKLGE